MNSSRLRYVLVTALIGVQVITLLAVYFATRKTTEQILQVHAQEVMTHLVSNLQGAAAGVLGPAEQTVRFSRYQVAKGQIDIGDDAALEAYFQSELQAQPGLSGMFLGRDDGSFLFVSRLPDGFRTKRITTGGERRVELIFYDEALTKTERRLDPEDTYDPRARPWYSAASAAGELIWTDPYLFFSSQRPGLTAAITLTEPDAQTSAVLGVDVEITALSNHIDIPIGDQGWALIASREGLAVAYPGIAESLEGMGGKALPTVQDIGGTVLAALGTAEPTLLDEPSEQRFSEFAVDEQTHFAVVSPLSVVGLPWTVIVQAPASDFMGPIGERFRRGTFQILGVGLLTLLLAALVGVRISKPLSHLYQRSTTDELTGLLSRAAFRDQAERRLKERQKEGVSCAVVVLDLDHFKPVNDVYGHIVGDEVLHTIGLRLKERLRAGDLVGRFGGDEFMVFLDAVSTEEAFETAERLRAYIGSEPILSSADQHSVGATAGVAMTGGGSLSQLIARADEALVSGKAQDKGQTYMAGSPLASYEQSFVRQVPSTC